MMDSQSSQSSQSNQASQVTQTNQPGTTKWLSLNEYSNKYHISISTLRRRIKMGHIIFRLNGGKYFLKDLKLKEIPASKSHKITAQDKIESKSQHSRQTDSLILTAKNWEAFIASQRELYRQLELKDQKISNLQNQLRDLQNLLTLLEKENKELKSLSIHEQHLEDWLDGTKVL